MKDTKVRKLLYEVSMSALALITAILIILEFSGQLPAVLAPLLEPVYTGILIIFAIDYFTRLALAKDKPAFIKANIIDLIAIIPFNSLFQAFRIVRLARLVRLFRLLRLLPFLLLFYKRANQFFKTNNFHYMLALTGSIILAGSIGICFTEDMEFGNALWWAFVTASTVGYGDISPATAPGRIIAVVLMVTGIGFLGMLTGTISTFFLGRNQGKPTLSNEILEIVKKRLDSFDELSPEEVGQLCQVLQALKSPEGCDAMETGVKSLGAQK